MNNLKSLADAYRATRELKGGYVVFYESEVAGWSHDFPRAEAYAPYCVAVDVAGKEWVALGGNEQEGAQRWVAANG